MKDATGSLRLLGALRTSSLASFWGGQMGTGQQGTRKVQFYMQNAEIALQFFKHCEIAMQSRSCNAIVERFAL